MTPSSETNSVTTILAIAIPPRLSLLPLLKLSVDKLER